MNPESFTDASGDIKSIASVKGEDQVCILEIPAGSSVAGTKLSEKYIQIGLNSSSNANITNDGLSIVKNACYYLLGMNSGTISGIEAVNSAKNVNVIASSGNLTVTFEGEANDLVNISVLNISGKMLMSDVIEAYTGNNSYQTSIPGLHSGVYLLVMKGNRMNHVTKFIVID